MEKWEDYGIHYFNMRVRLSIFNFSLELKAL